MDEIESGVVVASLVQLFKYYGMKTKFLPLVSIILGPIVTIGKALSEGFSDSGSLITAGIKGLLVGATTTGAIGLAQEGIDRVNNSKE